MRKSFSLTALAVPLLLLAALAVLSAFPHHPIPLPPPAPWEKSPPDGHLTRMALPQGEEPFAEDFSDAAFIGDSRTQILQLYTGLSSADFFTAVGLTASQARTKAVVPQEDGTMISIPEALALRQYRRIYIMFGTNELGWDYPEIFREVYVDLLRQLQAIQPDANIYVQTIFPMTKAHSDVDRYENNANVARFNNEVRAAAREAGVLLLETAALFDDGEGNLPPDAATDGVHLTAACCRQWLDYLREAS